MHKSSSRIFIRENERKKLGISKLTKHLNHLNHEFCSQL